MPDIEAFIEQAKFRAKKFDTETAFLNTLVYKGTRFKEKSILDAKTHFKKTESFLHTHFTSCHPPNVKKKNLSKEKPFKNPTKLDFHAARRSEQMEKF